MKIIDADHIRNWQNGPTSETIVNNRLISTSIGSIQPLYVQDKRLSVPPTNRVATVKFSMGY